LILKYQGFTKVLLLDFPFLINRINERFLLEKSTEQVCLEGREEGLRGWRALGGRRGEK
jgi:hypothetical protein